MSDGLTMWRMYVIFCIWSMQACEFNNVLTTVQVAIYSTATIFYFALYLHCISLVIALHVQLQLKRGYENLLVYL